MVHLREWRFTEGCGSAELEAGESDGEERRMRLRAGRGEFALGPGDGCPESDVRMASARVWARARSSGEMYWSKVSRRVFGEASLSECWLGAAVGDGLGLKLLL